MAAAYCLLRKGFMKDKQARALAIVALVFMLIFIAALTATVVDHTLLGGSIGYIALCAGVFVLMVFIALKADGRGYSITKMNNEIEMEKIKKELEEQQKREEAEKAEKAERDKADEAAESAQADVSASGGEQSNDKAED